MKIKALLYCTKVKPYLYKTVECLKDVCNEYYTYNNNKYLEDKTLNGKIVAECDYDVEKINVLDCTFRTSNLVEKEILNKSCLTYHELFEYLKNRYNPRGYAIHINNLKERVMELSNVYKYDNMFGWAFEEKEKYKPLTKAPQNMMRVWLFENGEWVMYILISIQSQWLCKILNGEKTIEVRKKVLKEMEV